MAKYKVNAREITYYELIIEAEDLEDAYDWMDCKTISTKEVDMEWETDSVEPLKSEVE
jgi:hypothetical protein|tara:strand:+ start:1055 stop:1228 length:174 start_codon:yes stop_codon:yes gene_type:complete